MQGNRHSISGRCVV